MDIVPPPNLLKRALWFAIALLCQHPVSAQSSLPAERLGWKLAVHSWTFQKFSIFEAIDLTAALGIHCMTLSGTVNLRDRNGAIVKTPTIDLDAETISAIRAKMQQKGLDPVFLNMGVVKPGIHELESRRIFEAAKRLGITVLVVEPEVHGRMEELGPVMDVVEKLAQEYNIKVAIHNHPGPENFYWNPDTVAEAVRGRSPLVGVCADVGHWVRSGLDPVACLRKLEGRVITLHFKDLNETGRNGHDVPWGTGISNARGMLEELQRQKFTGAICVEYEYHWENSSPEIARSAEWFYRICADLASP